LLQVDNLYDMSDAENRVIAPSLTTGSAVLMIDYDETHSKAFEAIVAQRPHRSIYGELIGPVRETLHKLKSLDILQHKGAHPLILALHGLTPKGKKGSTALKEWLVGGIADVDGVLTWLDEIQNSTVSKGVPASPLLNISKASMNEEQESPRIKEESHASYNIVEAAAQETPEPLEMTKCSKPRTRKRT
jgi:hypothetical protein